MPPVADLLFYSDWLTLRSFYSPLATVPATFNPLGHRLGPVQPARPPPRPPILRHGYRPDYRPLGLVAT